MLRAAAAAAAAAAAPALRRPCLNENAGAFVSLVRGSWQYAHSFTTTAGCRRPDLGMGGAEAEEAEEFAEGQETMQSDKIHSEGHEGDPSSEKDETTVYNRTPPRRAMALPAVSAQEGIRTIVEAKKVAKFDESVELSIGLGLDPRKPNQSLRVMTQLPHGSGKKARIAVFARGDEADQARSAGAAVVGAEDLAEEIQSGNIDFTRCIATPDMMPIVGRVARILGPRGLMPNPKLGTVTLDVEAAVTKALKGEVELRTDKFGFVNCSIGKRSFGQAMLTDNLKAVMVTVSNEKPSGASGKYLKQAVLSSTMGKGVQIDVKTLDPSSTTFLS